MRILSKIQKKNISKYMMFRIPRIQFEYMQARGENQIRKRFPAKLKYKPFAASLYCISQHWN